MTDWKPYVRTHLPHLDIRAEREAEIIDELALQLEAAYDAALAGGASEDEAHRDDTVRFYTKLLDATRAADGR